MVIFMPMAHPLTGTNVVGTTMAVGGGVVVAASNNVATVVGQATTAVQSGQMTTIGLVISLIGFLTAGLPHAYRIIQMHFADRKDARDAARAEWEQSNRTLDLVNQVNGQRARLVELEKVAADAKERDSTARAIEERYEASQAEIAQLREYVSTLIAAVGENQADIKEVADKWNHHEAPTLAASTNPAPLPPVPIPPSSDELPALGSNQPVT